MQWSLAQPDYTVNLRLDTSPAFAVKAGGETRFHLFRWRYNRQVSKTVAEKLTDVVDAVRDLPVDTQEALVRELEDRVADLTKSHMSEEQRAEVKRRLAGPREYVSDETVRAILRRYNADL
jgi:putative addiction module component (TIGR02574 family)